ncbi:MAG TPA: hypothetical protein VG496_13290 [Myxococcales bacterium]|nr:hypothetical protein [Myxococcales bacterium]
MQLHKLFRLLVLSGAMLGGASVGCGGQAQTSEKKPESLDGGQDSKAAAQAADAGTADAGSTSGGGVIGW